MKSRMAFRALFATATAVAFVGIAGLPASADTSALSTTANVAVTSSITLSALTSSVNLSGLPNTTQAAAAPVTMNVSTNNISGYSVTVQAAAPNLLPANTTTNTDVIAVSALGVKETVGGTYAPVSSTTAVPVHTQSARSAEGGDTISNDYQVAIPFVNADTYRGTLNYVATTL